MTFKTINQNERISVGFFGCGNMAKIIALNAFKSNPQLYNFYCYTPTQTTAIRLSEQINGKVINSTDHFDFLDVLVVACKPQQFAELAAFIRGKIGNKTVVISIMAAITTDFIIASLNHQSVCRIMPNTPIKTGEGLSLSYLQRLPDHSAQIVRNLFSSSSILVETKSEAQIDDLTPLASSSIAVWFYLFNIFRQWGINQGISEEQSTQILLQAVKGSLSIASLPDSPSWSQLISEVASKGGITEAILKKLEDSKIPETIFQAMDAGKSRSNTLRQNLST